jgi:hypothetical protein
MFTGTKAGGPPEAVVVGGPVGVGSVLSEAEGADVEQPRVGAGQAFVAQPQPRHRLRPDAVDKHVAGFGHAQQGPPPALLLQVEHDAPLAGVGLQEERAGAAAAGSGPAQDVALGRLDLDHVRAHVGQDRRGVGPHDHRGQVEDADSIEGTHGQAPAIRTRRETFRRRRTSSR